MERTMNGMSKTKHILVFALLATWQVVFGENVTYTELAALSNAWSSGVKEYEYAAMPELLRLHPTESATQGVSNWIIDVLRFDDFAGTNKMEDCILEKNTLLWIASSRRLVDISIIGEEIVDFAGRLDAARVAAEETVSNVATNTPRQSGLRSPTSEESLLFALRHTRDNLLPYLRQYWVSQPDEQKAMCRSNIVERARLTEDEASSVFYE